MSYSRSDIRELKKRANNIARYQNYRYKFSTKISDSMTYRLEFPLRRFESIFGTAYPNLKLLSRFEKERIIGYVLSGVALDGPRISTEINKSWSGDKLLISIHQEGRKGYESAERIEKYIRSLPKLATLSPPRWWNRIIPGRRPSDSFMINGINRHRIVM